MKVKYAADTECNIQQIVSVIYSRYWV